MIATIILGLWDYASDSVNVPWTVYVSMTGLGIMSNLFWQTMKEKKDKK